MIKKNILYICIFCFFALTLCACSAKNSKDVSMYDLKNAMAAATDKFSEMSYASSQDSDAANIFTNISDMSYSKVGGFFIYYASDGTGNADEIAVIRVKNISDITEAKESLYAHLEKRKNLYSTYDKSQLSKLDRAKIVTNGSCAALIVADDADNIVEAFHHYLGEA